MKPASGYIVVAAMTVFAVAATADPRMDYLLYCGGCHLENGGGAPPEVPDLRQDLRRFASHPETRSYLARVPGSQQTPISDERISKVLNWMLESYTTQESSKIDFEPYSAEEVSRYRAQLLLDPIAERVRLMAILEAEDPSATTAESPPVATVAAPQ